MNICVYGWYGHNNLGDELFKDAFKKLFPEYNFTFTDHFTLENVEKADAIFFGGGSFLNESISIPNDWHAVWFKLFRKKILYIGVGLETDIHLNHKELLSIASLIATRTEVATRTKNKLNYLIFKGIEIPDLVYSLNDNLWPPCINKKSVLVLPNVSVIPTHESPHWKYASWEHFKTEMAQFLDYLIYNKYTVNFGNMCRDSINNDNYASHAISSAMINRNSNDIKNINYKHTTSEYGRVITQRYHGIVLSDMANVPCLPIHHHDKLKSENSISYYEISKDKLISSFNEVESKEKKNSIDYKAFDILVKEVKKILS